MSYDHLVLHSWQDFAWDCQRSHNSPEGRERLLVCTFSEIPVETMVGDSFVGEPNLAHTFLGKLVIF